MNKPADQKNQDKIRGREIIPLHLFVNELAHKEAAHAHGHQLKGDAHKNDAFTHAFVGFFIF